MIVAIAILFGYAALIAQTGRAGLAAAAIHLGLLAIASSVRLARRR